MQTITSPNNAFIKELKKLNKSNRYCRETGRTIAEGIHLAQELIKRPELIQQIVIRTGAENSPEVQRVLRDLNSLSKPVIEVPAAVFNEICPVETSVGLLCVITIPAQDRIKAGEDSVYLDGVQDPGNVGTIVRTAVAAGVKTLITSPDSAWIWSPKVLRAGMGAHFSLRIVCAYPLPEAVEQSGCQVLVADARGGQDLYQTEWGEEPTLWVFGNEGQGVSRLSLDLADKVLLIPIEPAVESLNVAIAASVCLFEQRRRKILSDTLV